MIPNAGEKIRRLVLGLRRSLRQFVKLHMETYPSYSAVVDMEKLTEMDEKDDNDAQKEKRKYGQDEKPYGYGGIIVGVSTSREGGNLCLQLLQGKLFLRPVHPGRVLSRFVQSVGDTTRVHVLKGVQHASIVVGQVISSVNVCS